MLDDPLERFLIAVFPEENVSSNLPEVIHQCFAGCAQGILDPSIFDEPCVEVDVHLRRVERGSLHRQFLIASEISERAIFEERAGHEDIAITLWRRLFGLSFPSAA
jgi:hypothetical protein